jgi:acetyl-CoA carboxylase carboxyltransferase component
VDGAMHAVERLQSGMVKAPSPALVIQIAVEEGQRVEAGDLLCSLEAMKMEMPVIAQEAGIVRAIQCQAHQQVHAGQVLLVVEPLEEGEAQEGKEKDEKQRKKKGDASLGEQGMFGAQSSSFLAQVVEDSGKIDLSQLSRIGKGGEAKLLIAQMVERIEAAMLGFDLPSSDAVRLEALLRDPAGLVEQIKPLELLPLVRLLGAFAQSEALFERNLLPLPQQAAAISAEIDFYDVCRKHHEGESGIREAFRPLLRSALRWYGVYEMEQQEPLREALWRLAVGHAHGGLRHRLCSSLLRLSMALYAAGVGVEHEEGLRETLEQVTRLASERYAFVADNARQAAYEIFVRSRYMQRREEIEATLSQLFAQMEGSGAHSEQQDALVEQIIRSPHSVFSSLLQRGQPSQPSAALLMRALLGRLYLDQRACVKAFEQSEGIALARLSLVGQDEQSQIGMILCEAEALPRALALWKGRRERLRGGQPLALVEVMLTGTLRKKGFAEELDAMCQEAALHESGSLQWVFSWCQGHDRLCHRNYRVHEAALIEDPILRDIHPQAASRLELWRLQAFSLVRLPTPEKLYAFRATAHSNPQDTRIFVFGEIRSVPPSLASTAQDSDQLWEFEQVYFEALRVIREVQAQQEVRRRLHWNRIFLYIRPLVDVEAHDLVRLSHRFEAATRGLGLEKIVIRARSLRESEEGEGEGVASTQTRVFVLHKPGRHRLEVKEMPPAWTPIRAMTPYEIKVVQARRLGYVYPYEILRMLLGEAKDAAAPHPDMRGGSFVEYDLDEKGERLLPIERPFGQNQAGVIVGLIRHQTAKHPEGMERVWIASDPTASMGALAEPECRRVIAAIELAEERGLPIEWLPISSGARIAMQSGTENLDWTARVLKRIIEYTQGGGVIHLIVAGVNVGAQSYWNAEATMLMHTRGLLIMTPQGAMVLTGKKALEYSGGVAAEDERGMGGFERIMGPNGQAQYFARDLGEAYAILFSSYRFSYISPHERRPRRFPTTDPHERSILTVPYRGASGDGFTYIGDIFDERTNPGRKKPFAIREVMGAVIDQDGGHLERYRAMRHAETAVVWDAHLGGHAVTVIGFESQPLPRRGRIPMDGPDLWTGGTLFPQSSKKVAWGIRAASGQRPVVVLANLSGFDGSPESLRKLQLEMGAEIGRAVVNFQGPLVFVVIGRYHGGAYVVFSKALNPSITALALEGSFASVIGGAPAAAVVFPHESRKRAEADERILAARARLNEAISEKKPRLREELDQMFAQILLEKQAEVAREFDAIHTVERAVSVGSLDAVLRPALLRPALIAILDAKS